MGFLDDINKEVKKVADNEKVKQFADSLEKEKQEKIRRREAAEEKKQLKKQENIVNKQKKKEAELILKEERNAKKVFFESKKEEYIHDAKLADKVYKAYITDGLSRLEKVNGRFLASQTIKMDILIEQNNSLLKQNNEIIRLLEKLVDD